MIDPALPIGEGFLVLEPFEIVRRGTVELVLAATGLVLLAVFDRLLLVRRLHVKDNRVVLLVVEIVRLLARCLWPRRGHADAAADRGAYRCFCRAILRGRTPLCITLRHT